MPRDKVLPRLSGPLEMLGLPGILNIIARVEAKCIISIALVLTCFRDVPAQIHRFTLF